MASYRVEWKRAAVKELKRLPADVIARVVRAVGELSANPFPPGVVKPAGAQYTYRLRIGDYRVVYTVEASVLLVEIVRVRHRSDAYR